MQLYSNLLQRNVNYLTIITTFVDGINIQIEHMIIQAKKRQKEEGKKKGGYNVNLFNISESLGGCNFGMVFVCYM